MLLHDCQWFGLGGRGGLDISDNILGVLSSWAWLGVFSTASQDSSTYHRHGAASLVAFFLQTILSFCFADILEFSPRFYQENQPSKSIPQIKHLKMFALNCKFFFSPFLLFQYWTWTSCPYRDDFQSCKHFIILPTKTKSKESRCRYHNLTAIGFGFRS